MSNAIPTQPRWGNQGRDRKGRAIWHLMREQCGEEAIRGHWLDVGCGSGGIAAAIASAAGQVTGVDPEAWSAWDEETARHSNLRFLAGRFDDEILPVAEKSIDIAICNQVYEHVADPIRLVQNLAKVLKPGGYCYFAGPNLLWPVEPHVFWPFVHWLPRSFAQKLMRSLGSRRATDLDAFARPSWILRKWFIDAGLDCENVIQERIVVELKLRGHGRKAALVAALPAVLFDIVVPVSPGFVFVLRKRTE